MRSSTLVFLFIALAWGSNFIYMKMAAALISPLQVVFARVFLGFMMVLAYALFTHSLKVSHLKHAHHFLTMSVLAAALYFYGFVMGSALLPSGIAGALSGSIPLFSFILTALFLKEEPITSSKIVGILVGFFGVLIIANPFAESISDSSLKGTLYLLMGALSVGSSFVYAKKFIVPLKLPSAALTTYQLGFATIILLFLTPFEGMMHITKDTHAVLGLVIGLGILGTGLAYIGYYYIIDSMGAIAASSVSYLPPVVALLIGAVIIGEPIGWVDYMGTGLILAGVVLLKRK